MYLIFSLREGKKYMTLSACKMERNVFYYLPKRWSLNYGEHI